jgi:hypothetical protein
LSKVLDVIELQRIAKLYGKAISYFLGEDRFAAFPRSDLPALKFQEDITEGARSAAGDMRD